ncbi:hypothetical protein FRC17_010476 [Serendipita sp. 399]|nr:hypothetical protein FRC17_010476 [Serendipita sp. 399]
MHTATNPPGTSEHQIMFFESHFTELKVGIGSDPTALNWCINGQSKWSTSFQAGVWYNFAYDINFSANTVGLWASTGSSPLVRVVSNQSASTSTNSADFHVGVLRLGDNNLKEDWYLSGVYIESGSLTTSIGGGVVVTDPPPSSTPVSTPSSTRSSTSSTRSSTSSTRSTSTPRSSTSSTRPASSSSRTSSTPVVPSTTSSAPTTGQTHWGQCGGNGWYV